MEKIQRENWFDYDVVVASPIWRRGPSGVRSWVPEGGPHALPQTGTVTPDVAKALPRLKVEYRLDKTNIIHCPIAVSVAQKLTENFNALMGAIVKAKPSAAKGQYTASACVLPPRALV